MNVQSIEDYFDDTHQFHKKVTEVQKVVDYLGQLRQNSGLVPIAPSGTFNMFATLTYNPVMLHSKSCKGQFRETIMFIVGQFELFSSQFEMTAEFQLNGNIHYHVLFNKSSEVEYQRSLRRLRTKGNVKFEYIKNTIKCEEYLIKDADSSAVLCDFIFPIRYKSCLPSATPAGGRKKRVAKTNKKVTPFLERSDNHI